MPLPNGYYVAVKCFSAKEERRRLVASLVAPECLTADALAFENHLNFFMNGKHGLDTYIAYGIVVRLNTTWLGEKFRVFSDTSCRGLCVHGTPAFLYYGKLRPPAKSSRAT